MPIYNQQPEITTTAQPQSAFGANKTDNYQQHPSMKIVINDKRKIFAIQESFNSAFPYLKLEFFTKGNKQGGPSPKKFVKHPSKTLGECRTVHNSGSITITGAMTVTDLEQRFADVYGLGVQVFRKSGKMWLETTVTEGWTLDEQNTQGESLSTYLAANKHISEKDHRLS